MFTFRRVAGVFGAVFLLALIFLGVISLGNVFTGGDAVSRSARVIAREFIPVELREQFAAGKSFIKQLAVYALSPGETTISGNYRLPSPEIERVIGREALPWEDLESRLEKNPWCEDVQVTWEHLPPKLHVTIKEAEPWLVAEIAGTTWLVSRSGKLLGSLSSIDDRDLIVEASTLPRLMNVSESAAFHAVVSLLNDVDLAGGFPVPVEEFEAVPGEGVIVYPREGPRLLFVARDYREVRAKLRRLTLVLEDLKRRGESVRTVDMRFSDRVIVKG